MTTEKANPWGISPAEAKALTAYIDTGSVKGAARATNLSPKTIDNQLQRARTRMGLTGSGNRYLFAWDRWQQANKAQEVPA